MSIYGTKYFLSRASFRSWLSPSPTEAKLSRRDLARRIRTLIVRASDLGLVAIEQSIFTQELSDKSILEWGPQLGVLREELMSLPISRVETNPGNDWVALPESISSAVEFVAMAPAGNACWVSDLGTLQQLYGDLQVLGTLSEHLDIYDRYLVQGLASTSAPTASWIETLKFMMRSIASQNSSQRRVTLTLRGVIPAQQMRAAKDELLDWVDVSRRQVRPSALSKIKARVAEGLAGLDFPPRILLEIREEQPRVDLKGPEANEWFHGRFIHFPRIALISSDRSMDFVGRASWRQDPSTKIEQIINCQSIRDNGLVRWPHSQFSEVKLQRRWAQQVSLQKGGPVELVP